MLPVAPRNSQSIKETHTEVDFRKTEMIANAEVG